MIQNLIIVFLVLISMNLNAQRKILASSEKDIIFLENLLKSQPEKFDSILTNKDSLRLQIIYTQIDRDASNNPVFKDFTFNVSNQYFYPASTVKMPISLLALEKLNNLKKAGVDKNTIMITDSSYDKEDRVYNLSTAEHGKPTIANYIKEIFLVSDNNAFNRLYEFLGQGYLNQQLHTKGYKDVEILHRLSIPLTIDQNKHTNSISFVDTTGNLLYKQQAQYSTLNYTERSDKIGRGYYTGGSLLNAPFDFSTKNRISLSDLHSILKSVIFPNAVPARQRFNLTKDDYNFLHKYMSIHPRENKFPAYDTAEYHDAYVKFLLFGNGKEPMPGNLRIFNKVGDAYGFLTDVAYIVDFDTNIEFMLSATMLCNSDGIFNDDKYDYDTVGFPFMKNLGQLIYDYEKTRKRKHVADLSSFKIDYSLPGK